MLRRTSTLTVLLTLAAPAMLLAEGEKNTDEALKTAVLHAKFKETFTNAVMVGSFTIVGRNDENPPKPERYEIQSVTKMKGDYWTFVAKIQYGKKKATLPIPITVKVIWAGDTPMITLTDLTIPGMGTFSSRVLIHGDRYAGTWQHDAVGGHMFGRIEKAKDTASESKKEE